MNIFTFRRAQSSKGLHSAPQRLVSLIPHYFISVSALFLGWAFLFWGGGMETALIAIRSASWPSVEGVITVSELIQRVEISRDRETTIDSVDIDYAYAVNGARYVGHTVWFGEYYSGKSVRRILGSYPAGRTVAVYYDPVDPTTAVLEPGIRLSSFVFFGLGFLFIVIGLHRAIMVTIAYACFRRKSAFMASS